MSATDTIGSDVQRFYGAVVLPQPIPQRDHTLALESGISGFPQDFVIFPSDFPLVRTLAG